MSSLCFPNPDALRLALAAGIVPAELAARPVDAGCDDAGRTWVSLPDGFPKDVLGSLTRIGVTRHGPGVFGPTLPHPNWFSLVALRPDPLSAIDGPVLLSVPDRDLAAFAAEVQRLRPQRLASRPALAAGRSWLWVNHPPLAVLLKLREANVEAFLERCPGIWIAAGWRHPLESQLNVPPGETAVVRHGKPWESEALPPGDASEKLFSLPQRVTAEWVETNPRERLESHFQLRSVTTPRHCESLWVFPADRADAVAAFTRETDERVLSTIAVAFASERGGGRRTLIRVAVNPGRLGFTLPDAAGYASHESVPMLYVPAGRELSPQVRPEVLAQVFDLGPDSLVWLEPNEAGRWRPQRIAIAAFRPLVEIVSYSVERPVALAAERAFADPFRPAKFAHELEHSKATPAKESTVEPPYLPREPSAGWLERLGKLFAAIGPRGSAAFKPVAEDGDYASPVEGRVEEKLASTQSLLLGNEWAARRNSLEEAVLSALPASAGGVRANVWAELADLYAAGGNLADASVCWVNALWDRDGPGARWSAAWLRTEARAARVGQEGREVTAMLRHAWTAPTARVAAAYLTWAADQPQLPEELPARLPRVLALLDQHEADLPVRMVWLARRAAARLSDGDPLGLARCRDRLFRRLAEAGPGLDLDAPSFLRFRGVTGGDRFQTAREWLVKIRDPMHRWIAKLTGVGRLQWAGIDPEAAATTSYADLLLAWGLSRLGDRSRAKEVEAQASAALGKAVGFGVDANVHRILLAAFVDRIRTAQDGRLDRPGLPLEAAAELARLDDLGRYSVDKLRAHSGVLEPIDRVNPYRGRDLGGFVGNDSLGDRLTRLLARPDLAPDTGDIRELLSLMAAQPIAAVVPRVAFALLEIAPRLEHASIAELLGFVARAVDLTPEWLRLQAPRPEPSGFGPKFEARIVVAACHAAVLAREVEPFRKLARELSSGSRIAALSAASGPFFSTLRRLGLTAEAGEVLTRFERPAKFGPTDLGCATGYFAAGAEVEGNRILNKARERLFVIGIADVRDRTAMALAYAAALAHAPPRMALGRLEEIFLRLEGVTATGATNRYYTLKPLELVDAVVRAVASDDFAVGPLVRGWLDDDEFAIRKRIARDLEAGLS